MLTNADFIRLWSGSGFNALGMTGEQVVIGSILFRLTGSSEWIGIAMALYFMPLAIFGNLSGIIADWMDRRKFLFRIEGMILVNLLMFSLIMTFGLADLWLVLCLTLVSGSLRAMHGPVRTSYTYDLLGEKYVVSGLGLLNFGTRSGQLVGALVSGAVIERLGSSIALLILLGTQCISMVWVFFLKTAGRSASKVHVPIRENLKEYLREFLNNRTLLIIVAVTGCVEIFGFSFATALPELAEGRFNLGAEGLGFLHAARALGGMVTGILLAMLISLKSHGRLYIIVIFIFGIGMILLSEADRFSLAVTAIFLIAMMATASDILTQSMLQLNVPNDLRGRAMGIWSLAIGLAPFGHLEMGFLIVALGMGGALMTNGFALIITGIIVLKFLPGLRKL